MVLTGYNVSDIPSEPSTRPPSSLRPAKFEEPYNVFSPCLKWVVVIIIGIAGLFSGLSSNIYFPSLDIIAHVSPSIYAAEAIGFTLNTTHPLKFKN